MSSVTQLRTIPSWLQSVSGMDNPDYVDLFCVTIDDGVSTSPEQWSRTAIERVAGLGGQFIWRRVLGLRLDSRPSTQRVGGWQIAARGKDWIRLEAASWFLTAHLVIGRDAAQLSTATFIRYDRPFAALIWRPASVAHRRLMPGLLQRTVRLQAHAKHDLGASVPSR